MQEISGTPSSNQGRVDKIWIKKHGIVYILIPFDSRPRARKLGTIIKLAGDFFLEKGNSSHGQFF